MASKLKKIYSNVVNKWVPQVQTAVIDVMDTITNIQRSDVSHEPRVMFVRYIFAVIVIGAITLLRLGLSPILGEGVSFLIYVSAIMIATAYGGFGPGMLATLLSVIAANYFFIGSNRSLAIADLSQMARLFIFVTEGILITVVTSSLRLLRIETRAQSKQIQTQQEDLFVSKKRTQEILHNLAEGYYLIDKNWRYINVNPYGGQLAGFDYRYMIGKSVWEVFPDSRESPFYLVLQKAMREQKHMRFEGQAAHSLRWFETNIYPEPEGISVFSKDVTEQALARIELEKSEAHYRTLIEAVEDYAIFALDLDGKITSWNEGVEYILGYTQEEVIGMHLSELFIPEDREKGLPELELMTVRDKNRIVQEGIRRRKDGSTFHALTTTTAMHDEAGAIQGISLIMRDVTERKEAEETIRYQALHDTLTGLANRDALNERFISAKASALRNEQKLAVLFLDLDRFKNINDSLGHEIGDLILREAADRLTHSVRGNDMVVRLGGDEFIILLTGIQTVEDISTVAEKIMSSYETVMRVQDQSLHVTASIGIAVFEEDGQDLPTLLKNADIALYRAKDEGRNRFQFYNYRMNLQSTERLLLEQDLRIAVAENQLQMAYQPIIDIRSGAVVGVEALVRWNHPRLGMLHPGDFIPIAEETGMINPMGEWILRSVCMQGLKWHQAGLPLLMSVNLSGRQFAEERIVETITNVLSDTRFDPRFLELEITETIAMENITSTSNKLIKLKEEGIAIAIDDFGTGYSSLSYLKKFPVHKLKIDKSFIRHAFEDSQDLAIVRAIISMGSSLNLQICAEGIENESQLKLLAAMECGLAQGYYISKPLFAAELTQWLEDKKVNPVPVQLAH